MAAKTSPGAKYTLITQLLSPGFFPTDLIKGHQDMLLKKFPQHEPLINEFFWSEG